VAGRGEVMQRLTDALVSITYGGEALPLAAGKATLGIYRREPGGGMLWTRGRQLRGGLEAAGNSAGGPFSVVGYDPMTAMRFTGLTPEGEADAWGYLLQEMAQRGVLLRRGGLNFVSYSHTETDIAEAVAAAAEVFATLALLLTAGTVRE